MVRELLDYIKELNEGIEECGKNIDTLRNEVKTLIENDNISITDLDNKLEQIKISKSMLITERAEKQKTFNKLVKILDTHI